MAAAAWRNGERKKRKASTTTEAKKAKEMAYLA